MKMVICGKLAVAFPPPRHKPQSRSLAPRSENMRNAKISHALLAAFTGAAIVFGLSSTAHAQKEQVLHVFTGIPDGQYGTGGLIFDSVGNLYGTTSEGGQSGCGFAGCGTVYELSPLVGGGWSEQVLFNFPGMPGGAQPEGNLLLGPGGNLYGTTDAGGSGHGVVYELVHNSDGSWTSNVLYTFTGGNDGSNPYVGLVLDKAGNLYGTTQYGGDLTCGFSLGCGVVFELSPNSSGVWTETVLHTFEGSDGELPQTPLILDAAGNLYGATALGGITNSTCSAGCGLVFKLSRSSSSSWQQKILYSFSGSDGYGPVGNLAFDHSGHLYGATVSGGDLSKCGTQGAGCGFVFELAPSSTGWKEIRGFSFSNATTGLNPFGGVTLTSSGNLVGTTYHGGNVNCTIPPGTGCGVAFELTPTSTSWTETVLHVFGTGTDGINPSAPVVLDRRGNLYGTTGSGGDDSYGIVFEIAH